jgi:hypothetical protein
VAFLNLSNLDLFSNLYLIASYKSLPSSSLAYMSIKLGNFRSLHLLSIIYALFVLPWASPRTSSVTRGRKLKPPLPMTKPWWRLDFARHHPDDDVVVRKQQKLAFLQCTFVGLLDSLKIASDDSFKRQ